MDQKITDNFAIYLGDCCEVMQSLKSESIHFSIYSPPFGGLYNYSSSDRDLSNCRSYEDFFAHYGFVVAEKARLTIPGRLSMVHCMDVPSGNSGKDHLRDFPGDIIRLHEKHGWVYCGIGVAKANIVGYNPATDEVRQMVEDQERSAGTGQVYRGTDGKAYGLLKGGASWLQMFDGVAIGMVLWPELFTTGEAHVYVDDRGYTRVDPDRAPNCTVGVTIRDREFIDRMARRILEQDLGR